MTALIMMWRFLSKESKTGRLSADMYQHQVCHLSGHLPLNTRHQDEAVALGTSECVLLDPPQSFTQVVSKQNNVSHYMGQHPLVPIQLCV